MNRVSISELKTNPTKIINQAEDFPVVVENRNKAQAYLVGKALYEKLVAIIEDLADIAVVKSTNFSKGRDFEKVAQEFGI